MKPSYTVTICNENGEYVLLTVKGKNVWKTYRTAYKHAMHYKGEYLRDSWVNKVYL